MQELEKKLRVLQKKLEQSRRHRETLERLRDKDQMLYDRLLAELREARTSLERSNEELKRTQAQLIQQEKMASLGQLTAGIAHEINNPLNFVNNFAEINRDLVAELREGLAGYPGALAAVADLLSDLDQNASFIAHHGKRADGIVKAMMQHAAGGSGRRQSTDLNALVSEYVDLAYHGKLAQDPGFTVDITRDLASDVGKVEVVPQGVGKVLVNLLTNAFDAVQERMADGKDGYEARVRVSTKRAAGRAEIRVSDNGSGIPSGVREKIFEPFFTTKPTGRGTGLGLSLSYDIVTQGHSGSLSLDSAEGEGTTILVSLPI